MNKHKRRMSSQHKASRSLRLPDFHSFFRSMRSPSNQIKSSTISQRKLVRLNKAKHSASKSDVFLSKSPKPQKRRVTVLREILEKNESKLKEYQQYLSHCQKRFNELHKLILKQEDIEVLKKKAEDMEPYIDNEGPQEILDIQTKPQYNLFARHKLKLQSEKSLDNKLSKIYTKTKGLLSKLSQKQSS